MTATHRLLLATRNRHKLTELRRILTGVGSVELVGLADVPEYPEAPETGLTFAENALLKAREGLRHTGLPTIADDSGLVVDAFGNAPGVFSARWAGRHGDDEANLQLLLAQLADVPDANRQASFVCAAALALPGGREHLVDGRQPGVLTRGPRGGGGFGYDPIFVADGETRTNAELDPAEKDAISHRGQAFRAMGKLIARVLIDGS
ncbi:RdgB/HAM1 family non-canonical purine NTP pyrophosphatase [Natronosporangium hydrolyticum]|uniref:dITP/XTP pyrophosphatase n=1 Tax=Natronosporangium hydrolyticum TaxID=2811111 RepID=A0A895Y7U3_9ACTN|nr:RdgB/HAM1 family non-canonical purine NTP pyrophosphatase [Natronosporangium hydrolyticum]QSB13787.1 RdgB/HAM1 family non-canonical purine NTP pyrophosphatase [Natronosporangium hydrolyticum]